MTKPLEALISSEIADFFAGFVEIHTELGGPNTVEEAQWQLTERVTRIASECEAALIAALEQSEKQRESWKRLAQTNISEREKDIAELEAARKRIAELQPDCRNILIPALDGLDEIGLRSVVQTAIDKYASLHVHFTEKVNRIAELEASQLAVKLPPHKFSECVNGLLEEAIAYAGTQQLRARLAGRLSNFVKPGHEAGITVQGDE